MPTDDRLRQLREAADRPLPSLDPDELAASARAVLDWSLEHLRTLPDQPIGQTLSVEQARHRLGGLPPEAGRPFQDLFRQFTTDVAPYAYRVNHPRFLAFVPGAPCEPSVLGDWLTAACNFFAGVWLEGSAPAQIETTVLDWFRSWIGLPASTRGVLTTGGSEANLIALVVARESLPPSDWERAVLYVPRQRHWSLDRAARVMGLRPERIRAVAEDGEFRLRGPALREQIHRDRAAGLRPWALAASAGATNTGTVDALPELAAVCREEGLWLHADGAYGWAGVLCESGRDELRGLELVDSITLDPHKWLAQTFDVGCVLIREGRRLAETFSMRPDYLQDVEPNEGEINYADHGIALTRRFRALKIWLSLQWLGLDWFRQLVQRNLDQAAYAQALLEERGCFEILCPRRLSIICFRYLPTDGRDIDQANVELLQRLKETGRAFLSSTRLQGRFTLRMCFVNWRTTAGDVEEVVDLLARLGPR